MLHQICPSSSDAIGIAPVVGYEGLYEVTSEGDVFSVDRIVPVNSGHHNRKTVPRRKLKARVREDGYIVVSLSRNGKGRLYRVHRLVMEAFSPLEGSDLLDVNHKDGNKANNSLSNLEWCTRGENHKHRYQVLGQKHSMTGKFGELHHRSMPVEARPIGGNGDAIRFESMMEAERAGYLSSKISLCVNGKRSTHGGMVWRACE